MLRQLLPHVRTASALPRLFTPSCTAFLSNSMVGREGGIVRTKSGAKVSLHFAVKDQPGALEQALRFFWKNQTNMTRLESRPDPRTEDFAFQVSIEGTPDSESVRNLLVDLTNDANVSEARLLPTRKVPWFPTCAEDLDLFANNILSAGSDLDADHPGFNDPVYRKRRGELAGIAASYRHGDPIPFVDYTEAETQTWREVFDKLYPQLQKHACSEYLEQFENLGITRDAIPQARDMATYLKKASGFTVRPIAGLLSARDFLNALAFKTFMSTCYLRHGASPQYTPEPDLCHELIGHLPLFADPAFAQFSMEIGRASIGASDEQITQLARCYWFSVEFGLCLQEGERKAYGAGLLSSFGELQYSMTDEPEVRRWDPFEAAKQDYPITCYQPTYFIADSFEDATIKMKEFAASFARPFYVRLNEETRELILDRDVERLPAEMPSQDK